MNFKVLDLGLIGYKEAWEIQQKVFSQVKDGLFDSALITCSHYPVITLGRNADKKNILGRPQALKAQGIDIYETERGGSVTYHGPGQAMLYPVFDLQFFKKDLHWFLRQLEEAVIVCLSDYGINGYRRGGLTGVWVNDEKIASIGIAVRNWIAFHGLSLNVKKNDLERYSLIRPCGLDIKMTALESAAGGNINMKDVKESLISKAIHIFEQHNPISPLPFGERDGVRGVIYG